MHTRRSVVRAVMVVMVLSMVLPMVSSIRVGSVHAAPPMTTLAEPDTVAPAPIINLTAETGPLPGTVILYWNASGDDATAGTATAYVIRYASAPVDDAAWDTATDVTGEPAPQTAGTPQTMVVGGLAAGAKIYFAVKSQDEVPNTSTISNVAAVVS